MLRQLIVILSFIVLTAAQDPKVAGPGGVGAVVGPVIQPILLTPPILLNPILSTSRPGIAATTKWVDPAGITHTYYLWKYNPEDKMTVPLSYCQSVAPADVRAAIGAGETVYLATVTSEAERIAVRDMVKSQKAPFLYSKNQAYWVDSAYDSKKNAWVSLQGECYTSYIPWGDGCKNLDKEPGNPVNDFCTTFDMRDDVLCVASDKCSGPADAGKTPDPNRKCFYDGVYNNVGCTSTQYGCIFESQPFPVPATQLACSSGDKCPSGSSLLQNGDFELGQYTDAPAGWDTFTANTATAGSLFGWALTAGGLDAVYVWQSYSGKRVLDMNSVAPATIRQTVFLDKSPRQYNLNFHIAANPSCPATSGAQCDRPLQATVYTIGGQAIATQKYVFNAAGKTATNMGWTAQTLAFSSVAGDGAYIIEFKSLIDGAAGPALDGVTLCAGSPIVVSNPCNSSVGSLLANGNFEAGNFVSNSPVAGQFDRVATGGTEINNWVVTAGNVDWLTNTYWQNHGNSGKSISIVGPDVSKGIHTTIQQTVTVPDTLSRIYTLKFFMSAPIAGNPQKIASVNVINKATGSVIATQTYVVDTSAIKVDQTVTNFWQEKTLQWTSVAGSGVYIIQIVGQTANGAFGAAFDDISLCQGPIAVVAPNPCAPATNVIVNGHFDQGTTLLNYNGENLAVVAAGSGQYDYLPVGSTAITGWTVGGHPVIYNSLAWKNADNGLKSVALFPATATTPASSITQLFDVPAVARLYVLTFSMSGLPFKGSISPKAVRVTIRSSLGHYVSSDDFTFDSSKITALNMGWQQKTFVFGTYTADKQYRITFTDISKGPGGAVIDNIQICTSSDIAPESPCQGKKDYILNPEFNPAAGTKHTGGVFDVLPIGSPNLAPWAITNGTVDHIYNLWQNNEGSLYSIDLSGSPGRADIRQLVKLEPTAASYTVRFALSGNPQGLPIVKNLQVNIRKTDNSIVASRNYVFDTAGKTEYDMGWTTRTLNFRTIEGITDYFVEFSSQDQGSFGPVVDSVSLCYVSTTPLPTTEPLRCAANTLPNLVRNGGFERNSLLITTQPFDTLAIGTTALDYWSLVAGSIDVKYAGFWQQIEGKYSLDMAGSPGAGVIRQDINIEATSKDYTLTWQMAGNPGAAPPVKEMAVTIYTPELKVVKSQTYSFDTTGKTNANPGWKLAQMTFTSIQGLGNYIVEFAGKTDGFAGIALDDIVLCANAVVPPVDPGTTKGQLTITADNTFEVYLDGAELLPADNVALTAACAGKPRLGPSKWCCTQAVASGSPRCAWGLSESFPVEIKNSSILAVHVVNFDGNHQNPFAGGGNPGALLAQFTSGGRVCSVTSSEWRCSHTVSAADVASGAWTRYDYDDSSMHTPGSLGRNMEGGWKGTPGEKLNGGNSIWYAGIGNKPIAGIAGYAQFIWGEVDASEVQMWCRIYLPTLYC